MIAPLGRLTPWAVLAALLAGAVAGASANGWRWQALRREALAEQEARLGRECDDAKRITTEVSREYQDRIADLDRRLAAHRLRPAKCVVPAPGPARGPDAAAGAEPAGQAGVSSDALYDIGGECEKYRLQVIGLQDFVRRERK